MLEPRSASGQAGGQQRRHASATSSTRAAVQRAVALAVAALVEGDRRQVRGAAQRAPKSKWFSLHDPAPCRITTPADGSPVRQQQRVGEAVAHAELRRAGRWPGAASPP